MASHVKRPENRFNALVRRAFVPIRAFVKAEVRVEQVILALDGEAVEHLVEVLGRQPPPQLQKPEPHQL